MNMHVPSLQRSLSDVVAEYDLKLAALPEAAAAFARAGDELKMAAIIGGTHGQTTIDTGRIYESDLKRSLLKSAWRHVYSGLNIDRLASPTDKRRFEMAMEQPAPFTLDNIRATFGHFVADPRGNILRALAEVFCGLDHAYKSHEKIKFGAEKLPKRVVLRGYGRFSTYGRDQTQSILNALAAYKNKPLVTNRELSALEENGGALRVAGGLPINRTWDKPEFTPGRGVWLKRFQNGNGHLFFDKPTLRDINKALAEFYGDVLADTTDERPEKPAASTAVSKDLQYYRTPVKIVDRVISDLFGLEGALVLEPSCGCGRFLKALHAAGARVLGIEVDAERAALCRAAGFDVLRSNFLETAPDPRFDRVVMNPPFFGRHYVKHVQHALRFLKPGGILTAILPAAARYDHGELDGRWEDLPVGSFSESGTNINTVVLTIRAPG